MFSQGCASPLLGCEPLDGGVCLSVCVCLSLSPSPTFSPPLSLLSITAAAMGSVTPGPGLRVPRCDEGTPTLQNSELHFTWLKVENSDICSAFLPQRHTHFLLLKECCDSFLNVHLNLFSYVHFTLFSCYFPGFQNVTLSHFSNAAQHVGLFTCEHQGLSSPWICKPLLEGSRGWVWGRAQCKKRTQKTGVCRTEVKPSPSFRSIHASLISSSMQF